MQEAGYRGKSLFSVEEEEEDANNKIDDEGVSILLQHLHLFPKVEVINVGVTRHSSADDAIPSLISDEMLKKLQEELAKSKEVLQ